MQGGDCRADNSWSKAPQHFVRVAHFSTNFDRWATLMQMHAVSYVTHLRLCVVCRGVYLWNLPRTLENSSARPLNKRLWGSLFRPLGRRDIQLFYRFRQEGIPDHPNLSLSIGTTLMFLFQHPCPTDNTVRYKHLIDKHLQVIGVSSSQET